MLPQQQQCIAACCREQAYAAPPHRLGMQRVALWAWLQVCMCVGREGNTCLIALQGHGASTWGPHPHPLSSSASQEWGQSHHTTVLEHNHSTTTAQPRHRRRLYRHCSFQSAAHQILPTHINQTLRQQRHRPRAAPSLCPAYKKSLFTLDSSMLCISETWPFSLGACWP